jgi:hypothetical protein
MRITLISFNFFFFVIVFVTTLFESNQRTYVIITEIKRKQTNIIFVGFNLIFIIL